MQISDVFLTTHSRHGSDDNVNAKLQCCACCLCTVSSCNRRASAESVWLRQQQRFSGRDSAMIVSGPACATQTGRGIGIQVQQSLLLRHHQRLNAPSASANQLVTSPLLTVPGSSGCSTTTSSATLFTRNRASRHELLAARGLWCSCVNQQAPLELSLRYASCISESKGICKPSALRTADRCLTARACSQQQSRRMPHFEAAAGGRVGRQAKRSKWQRVSGSRRCSARAAASKQQPASSKNAIAVDLGRGRYH